MPILLYYIPLTSISYFPTQKNNFLCLPAISFSVFPLFFYFLAYFNKCSIYPFWFHSNHMPLPLFLLLISAIRSRIFYNSLRSWLVLRMLVWLPVTVYLHIRTEKEFIWLIFVIWCTMNHASGVIFIFSCNQT